MRAMNPIDFLSHDSREALQGPRATALGHRFMVRRSLVLLGGILGAETSQQLYPDQVDLLRSPQRDRPVKERLAQ
jgi:hypothetical protein